MPRTAVIPPKAEIIREYATLKQYLEAFAAGHINLLGIIGRPGTGKSHLVRTVTQEKAVVLLKGHSKPLKVYMDLYRNRDKLVILDDAEGLYDDRNGKVLAKSLWDTDRVKTIQWNTTTKLLDQAGIPTSFMTTSRFCFLQNKWHGQDEDSAALLDRADLFYFDPTPREVHIEAANWFWDQEIFDFIGKYLHLLAAPSARLYVKAAQRKAAGLDWQKLISNEMQARSRTIVQELEAKALSADERVAEFARLTGLSRSTYFAYKKELTEQEKLQPLTPEVLPPIVLKNTEPPQVQMDEIEEEKPALAKIAEIEEEKSVGREEEPNEAVGPCPAPEDTDTPAIIRFPVARV